MTDNLHDCLIQSSGLVYPSAGGLKQLSVSLYYKSPKIFANITKYIYIPGKEFEYLRVENELDTAGAFSIWDLKFKFSRTVAKYTEGGRLVVEFPTADDLGHALFTPTLGLAGDGEPVGCWINDTEAYSLRPELSQTLHCFLVSGKVAGAPAQIEISNFEQLEEGDRVHLKLAKIQNPSSVDVKQVKIKVKALKKQSKRG